MKRELDPSKVRLLCLAIILAGLAAYFGQPLIHNNPRAIDVIVTVFSVLAGFLVAIIAIVGDPVLLPPGSWRAAELERDRIQARLIRHKFLFTAYLITLALVFLSFLFEKNHPELGVWLERGYLFFGVLAFALSAVLPGTLMQVQQERIDAVIEHRRVKNNVPRPE